MDKGVSGRRRDRPKLDQALAAVRTGDNFVVTKLDRLGRSTADLLSILDQLSKSGVKFSLDGRVYDWEDPMSRLFLTNLASFAEFESRDNSPTHPRGHGHRPIQRQAARPPTQAETCSTTDARELICPW